MSWHRISASPVNGKWLLVILGGLLLAVVSGPQAQQSIRLRMQTATVGGGSNPVAASRMAGNSATLPDPTLSIVGAGTIPTRTTSCGATIAAYTGTAGTINTRIGTCNSGEVVNLGAGTFTLSTGITFNGTSSVTLRGAGPNSTFLIINANDGCGGKSGMICIKSNSGLDPDSPGNTANWTAGYAKGTTSLTLSSTANLAAGSIILLDQIGDNGDADPGNDVYVCDTSPGCTQNGSGSTGERQQGELHKVVSVSGTTVVITPPLLMPNWRSAKSPRAMWSTGAPITGVGIEDLSVSFTSATNAAFAISFFTATDSWVKNIRTVNKTSPNGFGKHVNFFTSAFNTVRDSYFFGCGNGGSCAADNYGIDHYYSCFELVENNIFQRMEVPLMNEQRACGNVFGYNYTINNLFDSANTLTTWMQASGHDHGTGDNFNLYEGNDGNGSVRENYFGTAFFTTDFRNRWSGWEPANLQNQSVPYHNYARSRFNNIVGNVLGTNGYHTTYETAAGGSDVNCVLSIFALGLGGNCENGGFSVFPTNDANVKPSLLRWGNYDLVNDATRFVSAEVPTAIANYANALPGSQTLPNSLYLSAKPSFFGSHTWPPIGPDVTGGDVTGSGTSVNAGLAGHVYRIPARICFEDVMGGVFGDTTAKPFIGWNGGGC